MSSVQDIQAKFYQRPMFRQVYVQLTVVALAFCYGINKAVVSNTYNKTAHLRSPYLNQWIMIQESGVPILGVILAAIVSEFYGRRVTFLVLFTMNAIFTFLATIPLDPDYFTAAVILVHLIKGSTMTITFETIAEYSDPEHRFLFLMLNSIAPRCGNGITTAIYRFLLGVNTIVMQIVNLFLSLACLFSVYSWLESPYWLVYRRRFDECKESFIWLRGNDHRALKELDALLTSQPRPDSYKLFCSTMFTAALIINVFLISNVMSFYDIPYLLKKSLSISRTATKLSCNGVSVLFLCFVIYASFKLKRRNLFCIFVSIPFVYIAIVITYMCRNLETLSEDIISYVMLFIGYVILLVGPTTLTLPLLIEIIPQKYRSVIACFTTVYYFVLYIGVTWYIKLIRELNEIGRITTYSAVAIICLSFTYWLTPEVKGKTLLDIEKSYWKNDNARRVNQEMIQVDGEAGAGPSDVIGT